MLVVEKFNSSLYGLVVFVDVFNIFLNVEKIPLKELAAMADNNEITDGKTLLAIYKSLRRFGIEFI